MEGRFVLGLSWICLGFRSGMDFARDSANAAKVSATNQLLPLLRQVPNVAPPIKQTTISQIDVL